MHIALAQISHPTSFDEGLKTIQSFIEKAGEKRDGPLLLCFPENCLKGLRGVGFPVAALTREEHDQGLEGVRRAAEKHGVAVILPTERPCGEAWQNGAYVISSTGELVGYQTKNQLPPPEEQFFVPGRTRRVFKTDGLLFGVVICHEGWRYPETVRWAAHRGAKLVFHPTFSGEPGAVPQSQPPWGYSYYEKAMVCRAGENTVYFASVNFALPIQEAATSILSPEGEILASLPRSVPGLLVHEIDLSKASGLLASRYAPDRYQAD